MLTKTPGLLPRYICTLAHYTEIQDHTKAQMKNACPTRDDESHMPVIPELRRLRQEDLHEFQVRLNLVNHRLA